MTRHTASLHGLLTSDPPRLVARHQSRRRSPAELLLEIDVRERVAVGVANDETVLAELRVRIHRPTRAAGSGGARSRHGSHAEIQEQTAAGGGSLAVELNAHVAPMVAGHTRH
jgi:hypothetical protein